VRINAYKVLVGKSEEREYLEETVVEVKQYQNIARDMAAMAWTRFI
jgi:triosephosphate isomerase